MFAVEKMKDNILHRLESIPTEARTSSSGEEAESPHSEGSTDSSSDSDSIGRELLKAAALGETKQRQRDSEGWVQVKADN